MGQQSKQSKTNSSIMKIALVVLALVATVFAQTHNDHLAMLVHDEVKALLAADANLSVDNCVTKCDALFDLVAAGDEQTTDDMCKRFCDCEINNTCGGGTHTHP